ncbi:MAG: hypothetical protein RLQ12_16730 [Cyclobacteriaceae bacterium]
MAWFKINPKGGIFSQSLGCVWLRRVTSISFGLRPLVLRRLADLGGEGGDEGRVVGVVLLTRKSMDKGSK